MLQAAHRINGEILCANLHLVFWLSLVPFVTGWMGETHVAPLPTALRSPDLHKPAGQWRIAATI